MEYEISTEMICRVCTINSECFRYCNIFEKQLTYNNVYIYEALKYITQLEVYQNVLPTFQ